MVHYLRGILLMYKEIVQKQGCIRRCFSTKLRRTEGREYTRLNSSKLDSAIAHCNNSPSPRRLYAIVIRYREQS